MRRTFVVTAATGQGLCQQDQPSTAPNCATSRKVGSRSSRAIKDSWRLAGILISDKGPVRA
jgi:hypothetical protein